MGVLFHPNDDRSACGVSQRRNITGQGAATGVPAAIVLTLELKIKTIPECSSRPTIEPA
jgi:hypothetical protein